jgi:DNA modification methylase
LSKEITSLADLTPDPRNANKGSERGVYLLETSLEQFGAGRSILADKNGVVIAGNKTLQGAANLGLDDVIVVPSDGKRLVVVQRTDLDLTTDAEAKGLAIADNRASEIGLAWDTSVLAELNEEIDLGQFFFQEELDALLASVTEEPEGGLLPEVDPDAIPSDYVSRVKPGELWRLGDHRLYVGDCTDPEAVKRLFNGEKAKLLLTDPPYAVDYVAKAKDMNERGYGHSHATMDTDIQGDGLDEAAATDLWRGSIQVALDEALDEHSAVYVWHAQGRAGTTLYVLLGEMGLLHHQTIIWKKNNFVIGRCDYQWIHEPCFYGWKKGSRPPYYGPKNQTTVWDEARDYVTPLHPTQKPVSIFTPPIENHLMPGEILYDPFLGSGTAIIAAERTGRRAFGCEKELRHADTILSRWEQCTGKTAVKSG